MTLIGKGVGSLEFHDSRPLFRFEGAAGRRALGDGEFERPHRLRSQPNTVLDYAFGLQLPAAHRFHGFVRGFWERDVAHVHVILIRLAERKRSEAKEWFRKSYDTGIFWCGEYMWSRAFLVHIDDPDWLPWCPVKK
jgi:hypothetical protein